MDGWWQVIAGTLADEFSDLSELASTIRITLRLALAALLGGLIGFEREIKGKAAGLRTHMLVCLGAALFILVPEQAGAQDSDLSRVIQGIVAGIGFLGAGTILKSSDADKVKGLTTAASIWMTAAIGIAAGMGREASAVLSTVLTLTILSVLPRFERHIKEKRGNQPGTQTDHD